MRQYLVLMLCLLSMSLARAEPARPEPLQALVGSWTMTGDVRGKPVTYTMEAKSSLAGRLIEMRMRDVGVPSRYEAHVYIGHDADTQGLIVHWMDSTGAKNSVPHATGRIEGNTLQFTFAYGSGPFRDTFTYHPASGEWTFVLESGQPDGSWKHFARYRVTKAEGR